MPNDVADWTSAVQVLGGSVSITGTATVQISGTPAVTISGIPSVAISGTASVSIVSGTVSITGTPNINILSQSVNLLTGTGQVAVGAPASGAGGAPVTTTVALPAGVQALALDAQAAAPSTYTHLKITGHQSLLIYYESYAFASIPAGSILAVVPVLYARDSSIDVLVDTSVNGSPWNLFLTGLQNSVPEFLDYYRPPWAVPNQLPHAFGLGLAPGGSVILVPATANITVWLHRLHLEASVPAGAVAPNIKIQDTTPTLIGFSGALTAAGLITADFDFEGVPLTKGLGFQIGNFSGVAIEVVGSLTYSLS
jgi:hypothetical protein